MRQRALRRLRVDAQYAYETGFMEGSVYRAKYGPRAKYELHVQHYNGVTIARAFGYKAGYDGELDDDNVAYPSGMTLDGEAREPVIPIPRDVWLQVLADVLGR